MNKNIAILEYRAGPGGEEAKIWANDLMRMHTRYANILGFSVVQMSDNALKVKGNDVFSIFQFEAGTHRVQRIPTTERHGRIHTSTATVAVLPQIQESEILIKNDDLEWDFYRSGGKGGQNVNKVSSAVRVRHKPSQIVVTAQIERDQYQNRQYALSLLRARLWEKQKTLNSEVIDEARSVIGKGMRAEKIRTYNYPQNRVTDHRVKKSWHNLEDVINGKLTKIIKKLKSK